MRERDFQRRITDLCNWLNLRWYHPNDSRRDKPGFPDLVIVGPAGLLFAEVKTDTGVVRDEQTAWLFGLQLAGAEAHVWRPRDWPEVESRLRALAQDGEAA